MTKEPLKEHVELIRRPRQGEVLVLCPQCGARCKSNRSEPTLTRYYCPDCDYSTKRRRPA